MKSWTFLWFNSLLANDLALCVYASVCSSFPTLSLSSNKVMRCLLFCSCISPLISDFPLVPTSASRGFHATGVKRMGGHGHDEPYYLHAKHMYNLHRMKHQGLKVTLSVLGAVSIGVGVPVYAVIFQQKKTASGWDDAYILETYFQQHLVKLKSLDFILPWLLPDTAFSYHKL